MTPTNETTSGPMDAKPFERQDSFRACVASLLELHISEVPRFCENEEEPPGNWLGGVNSWLEQLGLCYIEFRQGEGDINLKFGYCIYTGVCGGRVLSVVGLSDNIAHNPAPDLKDLDLDALRVGYLVPFNPMFVRRHDRPEDPR